MTTQAERIPGMPVPYGHPSLVPSLVSLSPCGGRWCQVESGDTVETIARDVVDAATPGAATPASVARYVAIMRACHRWNTRIYGEDLAKAFDAVNADALGALVRQRWPAASGPHYGLVWCPPIVAWELGGAPLPLIHDAEPPSAVIDFLRGPDDE